MQTKQVVAVPLELTASICKPQITSTCHHECPSRNEGSCTALWWGCHLPASSNAATSSPAAAGAGQTLQDHHSADGQAVSKDCWPEGRWARAIRPTAGPASSDRLATAALGCGAGQTPGDTGAAAGSNLPDNLFKDFLFLSTANNRVTACLQGKADAKKAKVYGRIGKKIIQL